jgi:hypothetical protein
MGARRIDIDGASVTVRRSWAIVMWNVLTLFVYSAVWYYKVNREMRDYGRARGDSELGDSKPGRSLLAVTLGRFLVVPELVSLVGVARRVQRSERLGAGARPPAGALIALLIGAWALGLAAQATTSITAGVILIGAGIVTYLTAVLLVQRRLNAIWLNELSAKPDDPPLVLAGEATPIVL